MDLVLKRALKSSSTEDTSSESPPFESDGLMQLALLFAALIHDTEHQGVPNAQLVRESHPLALQYNDQSVAEQRSLTVAFLELLQPSYDDLRAVMFPQPHSGDDYRKFRGAVTSLILATDISTPARGKEVRERWETVFKNVHRKHDKQSPEAKKQIKTASGLPLLSPPREHPTPVRRRKYVTAPTSDIPALEKGSKSTEVEKKWVDCGPTPSTHFPRGLAGSSMHDSLVFWWFSPEQQEGDSDSVKTFSEEDGDAFGSSLSNHDMATLSDDSCGEDLEASISLISEHGSTLSCNKSAFSDDYPHESRAFQFSCSTMNDESSHHLLSTSHTPRRGRSFTKTLSGSFRRSKKGDNNSSGYGDMNFSGHGSIDSKPRTILEAFSACTLKRKAKKADVLVDHFQPSGFRESCPHVNSASSSLTRDMAVDLTYTDVPSTNNTITATGFDSVDIPCLLDSMEGDDAAAVTEKALKGEEPESIPAESVDEQMRSLSLIEHILLVSDVSHTMQCWDTMNMFAYRLSKEIRRSIRKGRSGGITEDPLTDWYTNQSAFLHGYILPLAQRLEHTGMLPPSEDDSSAGFLSSKIEKNLERWQDQGHDVIAAWKRQREQRAQKRAAKKSKKQKSRKTVSSIPKKKKTSNEGKERRTKDEFQREHHHVEGMMSPVTNMQPCNVCSPDTDALAGKIHVLEPFLSGQACSF